MHCTCSMIFGVLILAPDERLAGVQEVEVVVVVVASAVTHWWSSHKWFEGKAPWLYSDVVCSRPSIKRQCNQRPLCQSWRVTPRVCLSARKSSLPLLSLGTHVHLLKWAQMTSVFCNVGQLFEVATSPHNRLLHGKRPPRHLVPYQKRTAWVRSMHSGILFKLINFVKVTGAIFGSYFINNSNSPSKQSGIWFFVCDQLEGWSYTM